MPHCRAVAPALAVALALPLTLAVPAGATVQYSTTIITSSSAQPVGTGIVPGASTDEIIVFVEGALRMSLGHAFLDDWIDLDGEVHVSSGSQPLPEHAYGALLGTFGAGLSSSAFFLDDMGTMIVVPANVGNELRVGVNVSAADLAAASGAAVVHVILIPDGESESANVTINSSSTQPIPTGIVWGDPNDVFILLCRGAMRLVSEPFNDGWFDPSGLTRLERAGEVIPSGAYGAVLYNVGAVFSSPDYVGEGGVFEQTSVVGPGELHLAVNMSDTDLAAVQGEFQVSVTRIPAAFTVAAPGPEASRSPYARLGAAFPNPMNPSATIRYRVEEAGRVRLQVYDVAGSWVRKIVDEEQAAGEHEITWDGRDDRGRAVASGAYFYQLSTARGSETRKIVVSR